MPGPGGPRGGGRPMQKPKNAAATIGRIFKYLSKYKWYLLVVTVAIIFSALASVIGTSYMKTIIDDYLEPMVQSYSDELMVQNDAARIHQNTVQYSCGYVQSHGSIANPLF